MCSVSAKKEESGFFITQQRTTKSIHSRNDLKKKLTPERHFSPPFYCVNSVIAPPDSVLPASSQQTAEAVNTAAQKHPPLSNHTTQKNKKKKHGKTSKQLRLLEPVVNGVYVINTIEALASREVFGATLKEVISR